MRKPFMRDLLRLRRLRGQIEWEIGLTRILEQPYQNSKIAKNAILRVNFKVEYLLAHKELEGAKTIKIKVLRVSFPTHLVSPHSEFG
ncbi:hypothetical protein H5410_015135 [Solanum commersonii]|uniref:Uncharacterized protein n=1 Tax=Solanum commersonii TaxID=4109 RepID=A0A9J5ZTJ8_SOLCO|nr:hypothetical protein H5410_015135 [Solanum commersonii]